MTGHDRRYRRRCCVYRHYDGDGVLLYVGISTDPGARAFTHSVDSRRWVRYAVRMDGVWYASVDAAREAELAAIDSEQPVFNTADRATRAECEERKLAYERTHVAPALVPDVRFGYRRTCAEAAAELRRMITAGELAPGEPIKPLTKLAAEMQTGLDSMRRAIEALIGEGWLEKPRWRGPCYATRTLPPVPPSARHVAAATRGAGYTTYRDLVTLHIRSQIECGELKPGDCIPSLSWLAERLNVSVRTAQHAVEALQEEGLVVGHRGRGNFVATHLDQAS